MDNIAGRVAALEAQVGMALSHTDELAAELAKAQARIAELEAEAAQ